MVYLNNLINTFCVLAAVVHFRLGALVQICDPRDGVHRPVNEEPSATDVVVSSLKKIIHVFLQTPASIASFSVLLIPEILALKTSVFEF